MLAVVSHPVVEASSQLLSIAMQITEQSQTTQTVIKKLSTNDDAVQLRSPRKHRYSLEEAVERLAPNMTVQVITRLCHTLYRTHVDRLCHSLCIAINV